MGLAGDVQDLLRSVCLRILQSCFDLVFLFHDHETVDTWCGLSTFYIIVFFASHCNLFRSILIVEMLFVSRSLTGVVLMPPIRIPLF